MGDREEILKRDVNKTIKQVLSEVEKAAHMQPVDALHPYQIEERRRIVITAVWDLYRRIAAVCTREE